MTVIKLLAGVILAACYASQAVAYQTLQTLHVSSCFTTDSSRFFYPRIKSITMTATGITEKEESSASKTKEKETNSGLFRKISQSNKNFDYEEILSAEDVDEYQKRFHNLLALFPHVRETELRTLVFTSPLLLALETENLKKAVDRLQSDLPFIDPSYVISQRSCGLDLLLSCMSPLFDLETRRNDVVTVIGKERNVTEFLRRVPHCLTPRYLLALRDHCIIMKDYLNLDAKSSLDMVERWPGILGIDLLTSLSRFNASLHRLELVPAQETGTFFLTKILRAVPRALMQDMPRRAHLLRQNFPLWDLPSIIQKYPRILTQKIQGLKTHYEILKKVLDPLEISSDNLVNIFPRSLGYNPQSLLAGAYNVAALLPGLTVHDVYKRVPRLLSVRTRETLQPQIFRLQKSFQSYDAENNGKGISNTQNNRKLQGYEKMDSPRNPEYRNSNTVGTINPAIEAEDFLDDDDDLYLAELGNSEFDESDVRNKAHVVKLLAQMKSETTEKVNLKLQPSLHINGNANSNSQNLPLVDPSKAVGSILKMQFNPPGGPFSHTGNPSDFTALTATLHSHDKMSDSKENNVRVKSLSKIKEKEMLKEKEKDRGINDGDNNGDEINVTRIIVGNLDAFIDRYPYFMEKVNGWVKDFGPSVAYAVLSAVPGVLTKKPTTLGPILKRICSLISQSEIMIHDTATATATSTATSTSTSRSPMSKKQLHRALNVLLLDAPSILKKKYADVDIRLLQLSNLLKYSMGKEAELSVNTLEHSSPTAACTTGATATAATAATSSSAAATTTAAAAAASTQSYSMKKAETLAVRVPRLLIETKIDRIIFRTGLLLFYQNNCCKPTQNQVDSQKIGTKVKKTKLKASLAPSAGMEVAVGPVLFFDSIIENCPQILAGPSSTLARLFFASTLSDDIGPAPTVNSTTNPSTTIPSSSSALTAAGLSKVTVPLTVGQVSNLLDCNTKNFLACLSSLRGVDIETVDVAYGSYVRNLIERITTAGQESVQGTLTVTPTSSFSAVNDLSDPSKETTSSLSDSDTDKDTADSDSSCVSPSSPSGPTQPLELGSSDLERKLCGVLNDICSGPVIPAHAQSPSRSFHSLTGTLNSKTISSNQQSILTGNEVFSTDKEIERVNLICRQIGILF